jgi:C_GCAxxG_C_C family probable redox protein
VCQEFEIEIDEKIIPQIAYYFAGGIGNSGSVCGAVVGAVMAIGLIKGRGASMEEMLGNLSFAREFRRRFESETGNLNCRDLTGIDLSIPENLPELMNSDIPQTVCFPAVAAAYRIVVEMLKE